VKVELTPMEHLKGKSLKMVYEPVQEMHCGDSGTIMTSLIYIRL
jgi:hypothetical protein